MKVAEITTTLEVEVLAEDIVSGTECKSCDCPISRAVNRLVDDADAQTSLIDVYLFPKGGELNAAKVAILPRIAREFIERFDEGGPQAVSPIKFPLVFN